MQRPKSYKRVAVIALIIVAVIGGLLFPVDFESVAKLDRTVDIDRSFVECCLKLSDPKVQSELMNSSGLNLKVIRQKPSDTNSLLSGGFPWLSLKDGLKATESMQVEGQTEIGSIRMDIQQDKTVNLQFLEVSTYSTQAKGKVEYYGHRMRVTLKNESQSDAEVSVEVRIRLFVPWILRGYVQSRLNTSVEKHIDDFVTQMNRSLNQTK